MFALRKIAVDFYNIVYIHLRKDIKVRNKGGIC